MAEFLLPPAIGKDGRLYRDGEMLPEFVLEDEPKDAATERVDIVQDEGAEPLPRGAEVQADGSVVLTLREPVVLRYRNGATGDVKEESYETLHFHRLTGADMRAIAAADRANAAVVAIARSARVREGLMQRIFDRLDGADVTAAGDLVARFLGTGRTTGR